MSLQPSRFLRRLAALLIRGPEAPYVLADLDDAFDRDVGGGLGRGAGRRYLVNVLASALTILGARLRPSGIRLSWIDVKLGLRMLMKYPALTLVAVFALAIGIPVGLAPMQMVDAVEAPLPGDPDRRIHTLRYWSLDNRQPTTVDDLSRWRQTLATFESIGASRNGAYNLEIGDALVSVPGAEVTASTFDILGVHPVAGRPLRPDDEVPGAPDVLVLGADVGRMAASGESLVGRHVSLGGVPHLVVGVMPGGFHFPSNQQLWLPMRDRPSPTPREGRAVMVFGRLADGVTPDQAQRELTTVHGALAAANPEAYARLNAEVVPSAYMTFGFPKGGLRMMPEFYLIQVLTLVPLLIACVNVGLLIFARTATRSSEFAVRTALGASRGRMLMQVFTESLVLVLLATGAGLLLLHWLPDRVLDVLGFPLPYWLDPGVSSATLVRALGLAGASAIVAGVVPVLRTTGGAVHQTIQRAHARRSGVRFGGVSSALIVADVAVAVAVIAFAGAVASRVMATLPDEAADGIRADRYLAVTLQMTGGPADEGDGSAREVFEARFASAQQALVDRLRAEPGVRAVAVATTLPRMDHRTQFVEVDDGTAAPGAVGHGARTASVGVGFFEALGQPIRTGRAFRFADLAGEPSAVVVNTTFVEQVLGGAAPIGRRIRYRFRGDDVPGPWHEIVGVVGHLGMRSLTPDNDAGIYHPLEPGSVPAVRIAIERDGDPLAFAPRVRQLAQEVDPRAVIASPTTLDRTFEGDWYLMAGLAVGGLVLVGVLLALAASALYAIMSFTVAQRTREIGIRVALGADRARIAMQVARRALVQIAIGVALGLPLMARLLFEMQEQAGREPSAMVAVALSLVPAIGILVLVGLAACVAPTLRALRISPVEALKGDG